jgi:hypothetical protein
MKTNHFLLLVFLLLFACTVSEKPEFIAVKSVKVINANAREFTLKTKLSFFNKNSVGGTLQANDIHIFIDSIDVATLQSDKFDVPKKDEFDISLAVGIPYRKIFKDNKQSLLSNIMNVITSKKVLVEYKGNIRYELGAFHYDYPLNYSQNIKIQAK